MINFLKIFKGCQHDWKLIYNMEYFDRYAREPKLKRIYECSKCKKQIKRCN